MKKTLKRFVAAILTVALAVSPAGCGKNTPKKQGTDEEIQEILNSTKSMKMLDGGFTDILIKDEDSAIKAASESAKELGYENALNELRVFYSTTVDGETYYRLQQTYQGIPVYGRYVVVVADDSGKAISLNTDVRDLPDSLNTEITVSDAQIAEGVKEYAEFHWKELHDDIKITPVADAEKVIYDRDEGVEARVCVKLYVTNGGDVYEVVADGETGAVRSAMSTMNTLSGTGTDGTKTFPVIVEEDGSFILGDEERNISVFYFNGGSSADISNVDDKPVRSSEDNIFGNAQEETDIHCQRGVDLYTTALKVIDYYQDTFGQGIPYGNIFCGYDDMFDGGNNARGGHSYISDPEAESSTPCALLYLGANLPADSYGIIGHEYTHCIQFGLDAASTESDPGISEGIADVFGFFFEAYCTGNTDWDMEVIRQDSTTHRNAASPKSYNYPSTVSDKNKSGKGDAHAYATVISHIAYQMHESGEFSMDELQMVWYKMLCRLPHSPSYGNFRDCMEQAVASTYGNGSSKLTTVQEIMNQAGIYTGSYIECGKTLKLTVYDKNGEPYDDYSLEINGRHKSGALWWKEEGDIHQEYTVNSSDPYKFELSKGTYICTVKDNAENVGFGESKTQYLTLIVSNKDTTTDAECITGFGADYVAAPGAQLTVLDAYGNDFKDYEATAIANGQNTEINNGVLNLAEHNNYRVSLKNKKGKNTYYDIFTLRIKNGGSTSITRKTEFVGESIITGKVVDSETGEPLGGVQVRYTNQNNPEETGNVMTYADGGFMIENLTDGKFKISFLLKDYTRVSAEKDVNSEQEEYDLGVIQMKKNERTEGRVYAAVFFGRQRFGTSDAATRFYEALLMNKLPGYRTEEGNIHLYGNTSSGGDSLTDLAKIRQALTTCYIDSTDNDLGIFYYAGHCNKYSGNEGLYFGDNKGEVSFTYTFKDLLIDLNSYDFKNLIIIIDCCYAGMIVPKMDESTDPAFKEKTFILYSTGEDLISANSQAWYTFTKGMLTSSGLNFKGGQIQVSNPSCDDDKDGVVDIHEALRGASLSKSETPFKKNEYHNPGIYDIGVASNCPIFQYQYLEIKDETLSIYESNEYSKQLTAERHYKDLNDPLKIRWTSDDESIATVDKDGNVTGVSPGSAIITAHLETKDGVECLGAEAKCEVTVLKTSTEIEQDSVSLYVGQKYVLDFTIEGPSEKCTWSSSDSSIASVDNGLVEAISAGTATVTLEANNKSDSVQIEVKEPYIEADDLTLYKDESKQIPYKVYGPNKDVTFSSSDESIVSVDENGVVTGHEAGTALITLEANGVEKVIEVTVEEELTMEGIGLAYGHYEGVKPQGDGAIPAEVDLNRDGTFRMSCHFDLFSPDSSPHSYSGTYTVDRINDDGYPVLVFDAGDRVFEMVYYGDRLSHENFVFWIH